MIKGPKLNSAQWKLLASAVSNISQAIILFSFAAFFVPETVGLSRNFSQIVSVGIFISGLLTLLLAAIIVRRGK